MDQFMRHTWPGNIRELENAVEHACVLCRGDQIQVSELPSAFEGMDSSNSMHGKAASSKDLRSQEWALIQTALERHGGNRTAAAKELGIHTTTLWRKLRRP
jgi:transcriptional regulator with PAS, ATPase and Fis domain